MYALKSAAVIVFCLSTEASVHTITMVKRYDPWVKTKIVLQFTIIAEIQIENINGCNISRL